MLKSQLPPSPSRKKTGGRRRYRVSPIHNLSQVRRETACGLCCGERDSQEVLREPQLGVLMKRRGPMSAVYLTPANERQLSHIRAISTQHQPRATCGFVMNRAHRRPTSIQSLRVRSTDHHMLQSSDAYGKLYIIIIAHRWMRERERHKLAWHAESRNAHTTRCVGEEARAEHHHQQCRIRTGNGRRTTQHNTSGSSCSHHYDVWERERRGLCSPKVGTNADDDARTLR